MNVHGPALKLYTKLTQRKILSDSALHAHSAFKYYLSTEDSNGQCRMGGKEVVRYLVVYFSITAPNQRHPTNPSTLQFSQQDKMINSIDCPC